MKKTWLSLYFTMMMGVSLAQTGTISGRVLDSQTSEPLPFANVFINNTTIGAATDTNGNFVLKNVPAGTSEILYSFVGYQSYQAKVIIKENDEVKVTIKLIPVEQQLAEVQVKATRDKNWERQLKKFEKIFFGNSTFAKECKIVNPFVIDFSSGENEKFTATATAPIDIQNGAMGYRILFFLKSFWSDGLQYSIIGNSKFEDLPARNSEEAARWAMNRKDAYLGSMRHLFKSLLENRSVEAGFRLYTDRGNTAATRLPSFNQDLEKSVSVIPYKVDELVTPGSNYYEKKVSIKNRVEVHYLNKKGSQEVYRDIGHAVSWLEAKNGFALINNEGNLLNGRDIVVSGDMGSSRISTMLPLNYQPQLNAQVKTAKQLKAERLFETVYLQTNKPFYYPGEIIWFKGYMNYRIRGLADSLSSILYVDLINAERKVVQSKVLKIDSGHVSGNFRLPSELPDGKYALVAYTNWMRNYGDQSYSMKVLPILNLFDKPIPDESALPTKNSPEIELTLNKEKYHPRELVKVAVSLLDESDKPIPADLSVSVTDVTQVPNVTWSKADIRKDFILPGELKSSSDAFSYPIEYGINWSGEFQSSLKKQEPVKLTIVRGNFEDVRTETTAANGKFSLLNLNIKDSALYSFQALRGGATYGKVVELPRARPFVSFNASEYSIPLERKSAVQRVLSTYELPADATLLKEVEVTSTKLDDPKKNDNVYGKAEATISSEEISKFGSVEQLLRAKALGFVLSFNGVHWTFYSNRLQPDRPERIVVGGNGSRQTDVPPQIEYPSTEPFLTIDNKQVLINSGETVGDRLMSLDPNSIERIEISSTAASYIGANGGYGLVAVFLKRGSAPDTDKFQKLYIKGYETSFDFKGPDYADKTEDHSMGDFRSTLFWKRNLKTTSVGSAGFAFYTSDLTGQYRIVVEGVTEKGQPVHYEQLIEVASE